MIYERDRELARQAIVDGWNNCPRVQAIYSNKPVDLCDCDCGAIDGCKARVDAVAKAIESVREPHLES